MTPTTQPETNCDADILAGIESKRRIERAKWEASHPAPIEPPQLSEAEVAAKRAERLAQWDKKQEAYRVGDNWHRYITARGERYAKATLKNFECPHQSQVDAIDKLAAYVEAMPDYFDRGIGLTLYGPCGTGKDHLSTAICKEAIIRHKRQVVWVDGAGLFQEFRDAMDDKRVTESGLMSRFVSCDLLAISDPLPAIGALTEFQSGVLFRVFDGRYSRSKPTIVTLNVADSSEAATRLGQPILDRLRHSSFVVHCNWPSYRESHRPTI